MKDMSFRNLVICHGKNADARSVGRAIKYAQENYGSLISAEEGTGCILVSVKPDADFTDAEDAVNSLVRYMRKECGLDPAPDQDSYCLILTSDGCDNWDVVLFFDEHGECITMDVLQFIRFFNSVHS